MIKYVVIALLLSACSVHDAVGIRPALERCSGGREPGPIGMIVPHLACR